MRHFVRRSNLKACVIFFFLLCPLREVVGQEGSQTQVEEKPSAIQSESYALLRHLRDESIYSEYFLNQLDLTEDQSQELRRIAIDYEVKEVKSHLSLDQLRVLDLKPSKENLSSKDSLSDRQAESVNRISEVINASRQFQRLHQIVFQRETLRQKVALPFELPLLLANDLDLKGEDKQKVVAAVEKAKELYRTEMSKVRLRVVEEINEISKKEVPDSVLNDIRELFGEPFDFHEARRLHELSELSTIDRGGDEK
jgi:hypothetical protein